MPRDIQIPRICSRCRQGLPMDGYEFATCIKCREQGRRRWQRQAEVRAQSLRLERNSEPSGAGSSSDDVAACSNLGSPLSQLQEGEEKMVGQSGLALSNRRTATTSIKGDTYKDANDLIKAVGALSKDDIDTFTGSFRTPHDPLVSDDARAQMLALEVWKATGYRFKVHDHPKLKTGGHKTRFGCSQDLRHKTKNPHDPTAKTHNNPAMPHFDCRSSLVITSKPESGFADTRMVTVHFRHCLRHPPYKNRPAA